MAGGPLRVLKLSYVGDSSGLNKANEEAEGSLGKLGSAFGKIGKAAAAGVAVAGTALVAFAGKSIQAAQEAEAAQARLENILTNTGMATKEQIKDLNDQAAALEKVGVASAGNITTLQAQLATFDLSADTIKALTPAITDYVIAEKGASAGAADFQSAANGLAQALQGNFASLTRTGFVLDETTKELITNGTEAERAAALVEVLGSTYAGFNEAARETSEGQLVALKNAFGSLQETIGAALLPAFNRLVEIGRTLIERLQELWEIHGPAILEWLRGARDRALELWEQLKEKLTPVFERVRDRLIELWENLKIAVDTFREWWDRVGPGVIDSFRRLQEPVQRVWNALKDTWTQVKELFAVFRSGEGDGQTFQRFIDGLVNGLEILLNVLELIIGAVNRALEVFRRFAESKAFQSVLSGIGTIGRGIGGVLDRIPKLADGGVVTRPTLALVGEAGPEAVVPLNKAGGFGGGGTTIVINGAIDPESTARQIRRILDDSERRTGATLAYAS